MIGEDVLHGFMGAAIAAAGAGAVAAIVKWTKRRVKLTGPNAEALVQHEKQIAQLTPLVHMLVAVQKPQLIALMGILEALKKDMNGGFERAHEGMKEALDKFDDTLMQIIRGECEEKKP